MSVFNTAYNNEIIPLPSEVEKVVVQYYPLLTVSCILREAERTCEMIAPPTAKQTVPVNIKTPKILLYQTLEADKEKRPHQGLCNCVDCRAIKPRFRTETYIYATKMNGAEIMGKVYNLANVHDNGNICFGKRNAVRNPRMANAVYWIAPFNVDLWSVWKKHQSNSHDGVCGKVKHSCQRACQPVHGCVTFASSGGRRHCDRKHTPTCPNFFDPNAPIPDLRKPTPLAFFGEKTLYVQIKNGKLEFMAEKPEETESATATAVMERPETTSPPRRPPVVPCLCGRDCQSGCCNARCGCQVQCKCCLRTCGHECPCDIPGHFKRHLESYNADLDEQYPWKPLTKSVCGTKFIGSAQQEEAVFVSTNPEALARFDKSNWRTRGTPENGNVEPILIGFAARKSTEEWEVKINDQVAVFKASELNIC